MATFPDLLAGETLTAGKFNDRLWHEVTQGADQDSTSSTLANSQIVIPRESGKTYIVRAWIRFSNSTGGAGSGIQIAWTGDGTVVRNYIGIGDDATGSTTSQATLQEGRTVHTTAINVQTPTAGAYTHLEEFRTIGTNNLVLQFARRGAIGTTTLAGTSYCHYLRIG